MKITVKGCIIIVFLFLLLKISGCDRQKSLLHYAWWCTPPIPALSWCRDRRAINSTSSSACVEFNANLGYVIPSPERKMEEEEERITVLFCTRRNGKIHKRYPKPKWQRSIPSQKHTKEEHSLRTVSKHINTTLQNFHDNRNNGPRSSFQRGNQAHSPQRWSRPALNSG